MDGSTVLAGPRGHLGNEMRSAKKIRVIMSASGIPGFPSI